MVQYNACKDYDTWFEHVTRSLEVLLDEFLHLLHDAGVLPNSGPDLPQIGYLFVHGLQLLQGDEAGGVGGEVLQLLGGEGGPVLATEELDGVTGEALDGVAGNVAELGGGEGRGQPSDAEHVRGAP